VTAVPARTRDAVVIGGGVNGASIADALAGRGLRVTLVERAAVASGASGRSSALVRMHYTNEWDARLAWASYPVFAHWPEIVGGPPVFTRTGFLNLVGPEHVEPLRENVAMLRAIGVDTVVLSPAEVQACQPFLAIDDVGGAAYEPASGYASPADVVAGYRRRAQERGAEVLEWTPATAIACGASRVLGIDTAAGRIEAPVVVVAAGAWALRLCRAIGIELPARTKAIDTVLVTRPPELAAPHMTIIDLPQGTYLRPESGVLTIVGVPNHDYDVDPETLGSGLPPDAPAEGARILTHRIPAMERASLARGFRAFDLYSTDRHAILGAVEGLQGLYLATAFSGSGFKIAPAVGTCMAELIVDGRATTVDLRPFRPGRFAEGQPLVGPHPYTPRPDRAGRPSVVV
jgi:sarcosine oxidase subunit beta